MAIQDKSIDPILLATAKEEFLKMGFERASIRKICRDANVTTGAFYTRYSDKDALFGALIDPVIKEFTSINDQGNNQGKESVDQGKVDEIWSAVDPSTAKIIDLIYANKDEFSLLINCATGSRYENFIDKLVEEEEKGVIYLLDELKQKGQPCKNVSKQMIHMLLSAQIYAMFEIVRHDCKKEDALKQIRQLYEFYMCGWNDMYGI